MSIWFDKLGNKYADGGRFDWLRTYTERLMEKLSGRLSAHTAGSAERHTGEMVDYTASKTVTGALDDLNTNISSLRSADTALGNRITNVEKEKANLQANTDGGFSGGANASVTKGGAAIGKNAAAGVGGSVGFNAKTETGGSIGMGSTSVKGFAGGQGSISGNGAACGAYANTAGGGSAGESAQSADGFAGGKGAKTGDGAALGKNALCTVSAAANAAAIDAIQLGTGCNTSAKTLQVYNHRLMNTDGTIPLERMTALEDVLTGELNTVWDFLAEAGLYTEVTYETAGMLSMAMVAGITMNKNTGLATPSLDAPAGSISLLGEDVDLSGSITVQPYSCAEGMPHTLTSCLRGTILEDGTYQAEEVCITERPPATHRVTWWNNSFEILLYVLELRADGTTANGHYFSTRGEPFSVIQRGFPPNS